MADFICKFRVNTTSGPVQERIVQANNYNEAKKVIEAQFAGAKLSWPNGSPKRA